MVNLKIKRLSPGAVIPTYATPYSACFDLYAVIEGEPITIKPGSSVSIGIGWAIEMDPDWRMDVFSRSGHGFKLRVSLVNSVGKIDSDYRNEVVVGLVNDGVNDFVISNGDRIAQAELNPVHRAAFIEIDELSETERGMGGIGSTGK